MLTSVKCCSQPHFTTVSMRFFSFHPCVALDIIICRISPLNSPWNPITPLKPPRPHGPGPGAVLLFACSGVGQYVFDAFLILSKRTGISIVAFGSAEILVFLRFALGLRWGFHPQTPDKGLFLLARRSSVRAALTAHWAVIHYRPSSGKPEPPNPGSDGAPPRAPFNPLTFGPEGVSGGDRKAP